jgi:hypothetical protein
VKKKKEVGYRRRRVLSREATLNKITCPVEMNSTTPTKHKKKKGKTNLTPSKKSHPMNFNTQDFLPQVLLTRARQERANFSLAFLALKEEKKNEKSKNYPF